MIGNVFQLWADRLGLLLLSSTASSLAGLLLYRDRSNSRYPDGLSVLNSPEPAGEHDPNFEVAFPKAWAEFEEKKAWLL